MSLLWQFLFGTIPWEVWLGAGLAGSVALLVLTPPPFNGWLATALLVTTCTTAAYTRGVAWEKAYWQAEMERRQRDFDSALLRAKSDEANRAMAATEALEQLRRERDDAINALAADPDRDRVAIPEPYARRLYNLGHTHAPRQHP